MRRLLPSKPVEEVAQHYISPGPLSGHAGGPGEGRALQEGREFQPMRMRFDYSTIGQAALRDCENAGEAVKLGDPTSTGALCGGPGQQGNVGGALTPFCSGTCELSCPACC